MELPSSSIRAAGSEQQLRRPGSRMRSSRWNKASEALFALKPVAFRYKKDIDPAGTPRLGLLAEDVGES